MVREVHLVFKTHLDIGFTDSARNVTDLYCTSFIPKALETARVLRERGGEERLLWTTGSWLVDLYLDRAEGEAKKRYMEAIERGEISWHALPFTTHTEIMSGRLFEYGLSLSRHLDEQFGHHTMGAKMTDVPGHTLGMVPLLRKAGVKFLHIGVNRASKVPSVPPLFRWRAPTGEEILVRIDGYYGSDFSLPGLPTALVIRQSGDNNGPPSPEEVIKAYADIHQEYPGARIIPSDLSSYAASLLPYWDSLPVVTNEIGDTWIHGTGTDPRKISRYRTLLRLSDEENLEPYDRRNKPFFSSLLMVSEHTWGMDIKKHLSDWHSWSFDDFKRAKATDHVDSSLNPPELQEYTDDARDYYIHHFANGQEMWDNRTYSHFESSHEEQRRYVEDALKALSPALQAKAIFPVASPALSGVSVAPGEVIPFGPYHVSFSSNGSMQSLVWKSREYLDGTEGFGHFTYETFSPDDYSRWLKEYNRITKDTRMFAIPDFGKPGMYLAAPIHETRSLSLRSIARSDDAIQVRLADMRRKESGCPKEVTLTYRLTKSGIFLECSWKGKEENRMSEAIWLGMGFSVPKGEWMMRKLDSLLDPTKTQSGGNHRMHAVTELLHPRLSITPIDSFLVALGSRYLLRYQDHAAKTTSRFQWNLYNNAWGTNFPVWYGEDAVFRFRLDFPGEA